MLLLFHANHSFISATITELFFFVRRAWVPWTRSCSLINLIGRNLNENENWQFRFFFSILASLNCFLHVQSISLLITRNTFRRRSTYATQCEYKRRESDHHNSDMRNSELARHWWRNGMSSAIKQNIRIDWFGCVMLSPLFLLRPRNKFVSVHRICAR